jgi:hypothetical protein
LSQSAYASFASVFALIAFGHFLLALTKWRRAQRLASARHGENAPRPEQHTDPFTRTSDRFSFNYLVAAGVFFTGISAYCAYLA